MQSLNPQWIVELPGEPLEAAAVAEPEPATPTMETTTPEEVTITKSSAEDPYKDDDLEENGGFLCHNDCFAPTNNCVIL